MSRRTERVAEAIREVVSTGILFELSDPRVRGVTVTRAEVSGDLRHAKVYVSIMGTDQEQRLCMAGLDSATGFLQRKVASRLATRYTPILEIVLDQSIKKNLEIARILREVLPPDQEGVDATEGEDDAEFPSAPEAAETEGLSAGIEERKEPGDDLGESSEVDSSRERS